MWNENNKVWFPKFTEAVLKAREMKAEKIKKKLERDIWEEMEEEYTLDLNKNKDLENDEWKYDPIPQIWEGHNIADFIDPEIMKKLEEIEKEEELREGVGFYDSGSDPEDDEMKTTRKTASKIREKKVIHAINRRIDKSISGKTALPRKSRKRERSVSRLRHDFEELGVDMSDTNNANFTRTKSESRSRPPLKKARTDSVGRVRSSSKVPRDQSGVRDVKVCF